MVRNSLGVVFVPSVVFAAILTLVVLGLTPSCSAADPSGDTLPAAAGAGRADAESTGTNAAADIPATISNATLDRDGFLVHTVSSAFQADTTEIHVLLPDPVDGDERYPVVYVLPVEPHREHNYGDGLREVRRRGLSQRRQVIFVTPTFSQFPWYADHPTDPRVRQETYFLKVVVPFIEARYPARATADGRLLLGFSKSGWGAWSLLLRYPERFGRAVSWDSPMMMDSLGYGSHKIYATRENLARYQITKLLERRAGERWDPRRLILMGNGNFRDHHVRLQNLMLELNIPHTYVDGPLRTHAFESGWLPEAVELLLRDESAGR